MQEYEAGILKIEHKANKYYIIELLCDNLSKEAKPGQFVQVLAGENTDPFLRRTFSIAGADPDKGSISLLIDAIGKGTDILCNMRRGSLLNIIGPLGNGFDISVCKNNTPVLVGGGTGAAPLIFLSNILRIVGKKPYFFYGAKSISFVKTIEEIYGTYDEFKSSTDDGSYGYHGKITELLNDKIETIQNPVMFSCGPFLMMKSLSEIAQKNDIPCYVSLEGKMACGVGACLGCATPLKNGKTARICFEGPVFDSRVLEWK